eukprot:2381146-Pyramimonas_sp.AAC.1
MAARPGAAWPLGAMRGAAPSGMAVPIHEVSSRARSSAGSMRSSRSCGSAWRLAPSFAQPSALAFPRHCRSEMRLSRTSCSVQCA